jgi:hypothetical protein
MLGSIAAVRPGVCLDDPSIVSSDFAYLDLVNDFSLDSAVAWLQNLERGKLQPTVLVVGRASHLKAFDRQTVAADVTLLELPHNLDSSRVRAFIEDQFMGVYSQFNFENGGFTPKATEPYDVPNRSPESEQDGIKKEEIELIYFNPPLAFDEDDDRALLQFLQQPESE